MSDPKQDIKNLIKQLEQLRDAAEDELLELGDEAVKLIKKRTRLGYGVAEQGAGKTKLKGLSPEYKAARRRNKPKGPTTAGKSNLTDTGDMLDDLVAKPNGTNKVKIDFKTKESQDKAKWVSDDRPFNNLSKAEQKQLRQSLEAKLKKKIK